MSRSLRMVAVLVVMLVLMAEAVWGAAQAPNLQLAVNQRTFLVGKKAEVSLSTYNLKQAALAVYPVALEALVPNASAIASEDAKVKGSVPNRLKGLNLKGLRAVKSWSVPVKKAGKDYWEDQLVKMPVLAPGVYVLTATGGGVQKRTWFAVSGRAMLTKRSPKEVLAWVVNARTGQPAVGVKVGLYDEKGKAKVAATTGEGLVKFDAPAPGIGAWVSTQVGDPAFAEADSPYAPDPYKAYIYTDRPVYRPGHLIRFRGTVREVKENDYALVSKGLETVRAQIKTRGGSTVYDEELALNEWGSFNGEFQLAPEPPLGDYELVVTIGKGKDETVFVRSFEVEAYRKPEFTVDVKFDKDWQLGGDKVYFTISAKYLFGSPVAGGKVSYQVRYDAYEEAPPARVLTAAGLGTAAIGQIEDSFKGEGRLDKDGQLRLYLQTKSLPYSRSLSVSAEVSETALRPRSASASTLVAAADLNLSMSLNSYQYVPGETVKVSFAATDHEGKPASVPVEVRLIENLVDREGRPYEAETKQVIETDSKGKAEAQFAVKHLGYHRIEAWAADEGGNPVFASESFGVVKKRSIREWPSLSLNADKREYKPGETAVISGETDLVGSWMLVTVEGQRLLSSKVYKLEGHEFTIRVPITEQMQPNAVVRAALIRNGEMTGASEYLSAPLEDRKLTVIVTPNKEKYQPAETASYIVTTRDSKGAAVAAEVGLGVVDAGVYEISEDSTPEAFDNWWGSQSVRVETVFSLEQMYPGGAYQTMAPPSPAMEAVDGLGEGGGDDEGAPRVRRLFTDTAYWGPSVVTGADGTAEVKFTVPDNLTTWRATARGMTKTTQAGEVRKDVIVTMPLLVRLTLPRFYVAGDEATAAATVHNYTGTERTVKVTLTGQGAEVLDGAEKTITLANDGIQKLTWKIRATGPGQAKLLVSADGGPGGKDATESTLPVLPDGAKDVVACAGVTSDQAELKLAAPTNAVPGSALAEVTLSPSLAGPLFEALDYLTTYPYGCAEQTMDGFLPNMIVVKALQDLGANRPKPKMLDRYVSFGLQKLLRFQHADGGWHWWEFDESDPFISAYVVYGLKLADMNGYVAAHAAMVRGTEYLRGALANEQYRDAQAYLLWALAFADVWPEAKDLKAASDLAGQRTKLDIFSRASLALALDKLAAVKGQEAGTQAKLAGLARTIAGELEAEGKPLGTGAYWAADGRYKYSWLDNNVEVTSQVLTALLTLKPDSPKIVPAVQWLMAARQGKQWTSTKDTAAAVLALTKYLQQSKELQPNYTAKVYSGDKVIKEIAFTPADAFKDPVKVVVPALDLGALRVAKQGNGNLYYSARLSYLLPSKDVVPVAKGITVERKYRVPTEDPSAAGTQEPGQIVFVDVTVRTEDNLRYALLQEPIPAGCEVVNTEEDRIPEIGVERREVWDNKLVLYFNYLPRGERTFTYVLRTEAPGNYRILPSMAELMYFPEVRGNGKPVRMLVGEAE